LTVFSGWMPWKEQRTMSLKLQFVERAAQKGSNLSALCEEFGVSRQTGHKWLRRYRELGPLGLVEQSRRPDSSPTGTGEDVILAILVLRNQHPSWGPDKVSRVLPAQFCCRRSEPQHRRSHLAPAGQNKATTAAGAHLER
jgi:Helix-turn-helix domain